MTTISSSVRASTNMCPFNANLMKCIDKSVDNKLSADMVWGYASASSFTLSHIQIILQSKFRSIKFK